MKVFKNTVVAVLLSYLLAFNLHGEDDIVAMGIGLASINSSGALVAEGKTSNLVLEAAAYDFVQTYDYGTSTSYQSSTSTRLAVGLYKDISILTVAVGGFVGVEGEPDSYPDDHLTVGVYVGLEHSFESYSPIPLKLRSKIWYGIGTNEQIGVDFSLLYVKSFE